MGWTPEQSLHHCHLCDSLRISVPCCFMFSATEFFSNVVLGSLISSELVVAMMGTGLQCGVPAQGFS